MPKALNNGERRPWPRTLALAVAVATATVLGGAGSVSQAASNVPDVSLSASVKIESAVQSALARGESPSVLVKFKGKADLSAALAMTDRNARATWVYETLKNTSQSEQAQARQTLSAQYSLSESAHDFTVLWIDNSIAISNLTAPMLDSLSTDPNIASIRTQRTIMLPQEPEADVAPWDVQAVESSLAHIKVPDVWALGFRGAGVVVANIDAGVRHSHAALVGKYRGNLGGGTFDHNYNWYDPYNHAAVPRWTDPHGTHTMGTMVGDDGSANQVGAAPDAKWMACIGFGQPGAGATDAGLLECGQWTLAPYPTAGGGTPDPTKHADIVNNSWGDCGQSYDNWYEGVIDGWIAAGMVPVFSNGNASNCGYPNNPALNTVGNPARSGKVLGIGSTGKDNGLYAPHSNKGPTDNPNPGLPTYPDPAGFANLKPNVSAPGVTIRSSVSTSDTAFGSSSGTSMSAPAATGVIALMWSAAPCLQGNYGMTGTLLMNTATAVPVDTGSPSDGPGNVPNQATGWGEIDALAAVNAGIAYCAGGGNLPPSVSKAFAPATIVMGSDSVLTITLVNTNATVATLDAALTDNLPAGVEIAATPAAATTCGGGSASATAGGSSVSLASGATIPASGSCSVTVSVTAPAVGSFLNTIPVGGLSTDAGDNTAAANATLTVNDGGTLVCSAPINHVLANTVDGTSVNWATGEILDDDLTGYDINIWNNSGLAMYWSNAPAGNAAVAPTTTSTDYSVLQAGAVIGPASTWSRTGGAMTSFRAGVDGYLGFRYECAAGTCYGYAHFTTTSATGYPATLIDYCHDTSGAALTIVGGGPTHTVTPSVDTPSGTISPATPVTVNEGSTTAFTLTAASGFHIDTVGGTCGGSLAGSVYTTAAITADCTVTANFAANGGGTDPMITVNPASLDFTVDAGATDTAPLTIGNIGGGTLTFTINEEANARPPASYRTARAAKSLSLSQDSLLQSTLPAGYHGHYVAPTGGDVLSQMADNAPASLAGISCGTQGVDTGANSYWRRFYLSEHGAPASISIESVTVGTETGPSIDATINLYSIPHATAMDTIPTASLTLIGSGTGTVGGDLTTSTIPVSGTLADAVGTDLVVEYHIEGSPTAPWFPGANASAETHTSFISAGDCSIPDPTPMADIGFADSHNIIVVNLGEGGGPTCQNPADVPWLSVSPANGSVAAGASTDATVSVDAGSLAAGDYSANLCVSSNDTLTPIVTVPVSLTVDEATVDDVIFADGFDGAPVGDPDVVTGEINLPVANDADGSALDLLTGSLHAYSGAIVDDINLYNFGDGMYVYWYGDAATVEVGGVVDAGGIEFAVLQSGDVVGPASTISGGSIPMANWIGGADGYIGIAFENEDTGQLNYGYIHMTTTSPDGFPAQVLEYGYNSAGNAITIP